MAQTQRYAVVAVATNAVANIVLWDGESPWLPGEGFTVRAATEADEVAYNASIEPQSEAATSLEQTDNTFTDDPMEFLNVGT